MQDEGDPLGGGERVQHHEQRAADRVDQDRFALGIAPAARTGLVPDLVGRELAAGDRATYYTGGADGYVDYPISDWRDGPG